MVLSGVQILGRIEPGFPDLRGKAHVMLGSAAGSLSLNTESQAGGRIGLEARGCLSWKENRAESSPFFLRVVAIQSGPMLRGQAHRKRNGDQDGHNCLLKSQWPQGQLSILTLAVEQGKRRDVLKVGAEGHVGCRVEPGLRGT